MTISNLITYQKAKENIISLQNYVDLIDKYEVNSVEQFIVKSYAISNSSSNVIKEYNILSSKLNYPPISREYILEVIKGPTIDELHKIVKKAYFKRYSK